MSQILSLKLSVDERHPDAQEQIKAVTSIREILATNLVTPSIHQIIFDDEKSIKFECSILELAKIQPIINKLLTGEPVKDCVWDISYDVLDCISTTVVTPSNPLIGKTLRGGEIIFNVSSYDINGDRALYIVQPFNNFINSTFWRDNPNSRINSPIPHMFMNGWQMASMHEIHHILRVFELNKKLNPQGTPIIKMGIRNYVTLDCNQNVVPFDPNVDLNDPNRPNPYYYLVKNVSEKAVLATGELTL